MNELLNAEVRNHIREKYTGIFTEDHMDRHFRDYVGFDLAEDQLRQVLNLSGIQPGSRLLDIGCGYGSFVLTCLRKGIQAEGIDVGDFDIGFARRRLTEEEPSLPPESVFHLGDGQDTGFPAASFDVVTAWNVLEHVPDYKKLIREVYRLLRPGGFFIGIAPNYLAFRQEAHYHVPWLPLFPRRLAHDYLISRGLNPKFFDEDIHYVTAWGIQRAFTDTGFQAQYPEKAKFENPELIQSVRLKTVVDKLRKYHLIGFLHLYYSFAYWNPIKSSVYFAARKPL